MPEKKKKEVDKLLFFGGGVELDSSGKCPPISLSLSEVEEGMEMEKKGPQPSFPIPSALEKAAQDGAPRAARARATIDRARTALPVLFGGRGRGRSTAPPLKVARAAASDMVPRAHFQAVARLGARELVLEAGDGVEVGLLAVGVACAAAAAVEARWGSPRRRRRLGGGGGGGCAGLRDGGLQERRGNALGRGRGRCAEVVACAAAAGVCPGRLWDGWVWLGDGVVRHFSYCLIPPFCWWW